MFAERTVFAKPCEREFTDSPLIGRIDPLIEDDETGPRRLDPPTKTCNPPIECK